MQLTFRQKLKQWRAALIAIAVSMLIGVLSIADPVDRIMEAGLGAMGTRPVSGDIVVIAIDEKTLDAIPMSRLPSSVYADIFRKADTAGVRQLFVDFMFNQREGDPDFALLTEAVRPMKERVVLAVGNAADRNGERGNFMWPHKDFGEQAVRGSIWWNVTYWQVWGLPYAVQSDRGLLSSFAALMAGKKGQAGSQFRIDLSFDPNTIKVVSAIDLLEGKVPDSALRGKQAILASTHTIHMVDTHYLPGHNKIPGAFIHVIGAETLKRGTPISIGWAVPFALSLALVIGLWFTGRRKSFSRYSVAILAILLTAKPLLALQLVNIDVGPTLILLGSLLTIHARARRKVQAQRENPLTGLPNFAGLRDGAAFGDATVIAARIVNFDRLSAFLSSDGSVALIDQVARRLALASQESRLHHDVDGSFAWVTHGLSPAQTEQHLAGLAALFNAPLAIESERIDVAIAFGVNDTKDGTNHQRLAAALVAAEESVQRRTLWTRYVPAEKAEAGWKLSFHSQLQDAMAAGDIWVAYQPQHDIATGEIVGVEALARWTHPERGPIPPDQFIVEAERNHDIYRLTLFVLDKAIAAASTLRGRGLDVQMSVNLSAALLDHADLLGSLRIMLMAHRVEPQHLTIEVTETAQIENSEAARLTLAQLRGLGVRLSIDDYGTGQSNLEYLMAIDADEIKIDKRFVSTMRESPRNREVVKSTIELAHKLGTIAVAEGIEDAETVDLLARLGCDVGQGYFFGKPQLLSDLLAHAPSESPSRAATA